jgi:hypothetical protein
MIGVYAIVPSIHLFNHHGGKLGYTFPLCYRLGAGLISADRPISFWDVLVWGFNLYVFVLYSSYLAREVECYAKIAIIFSR